MFGNVPKSMCPLVRHVLGFHSPSPSKQHCWAKLVPTFWPIDLCKTRETVAEDSRMPIYNFHLQLPFRAKNRERLKDQKRKVHKLKYSCILLVIRLKKKMR